MKNVMLVLWDGGFVEVQDAASVSANNPREALLDASGLSDIDAVDELAEQNLAITATPDETIIAKMDDADPDSGWSAYTDFGLGDSVTAPTMAGGTQTIRCVGITVSEDGDGYLDVTTEWGTVRDVAEERLQRWLDRTDNGTLDGRSPTPVVSVSSPSIVESGVARAEQFTASSDGGYAVEVGDETAGVTPPARGYLYRVEALARAAGVSATTAAIEINGTLVCSVTLAANDVDTTYDLTYSQLRVVERTDIFTVEITAAGGHEGVSYTFLIAPLEV